MIFVTGDCHGDYRKFSSGNFPEQKMMDRNDFVIVCGDFGLWDESREAKYWLDWLEKKDFTLLWVDGNHENFNLLKTYPAENWAGGKVQRIRSNVIHLMRGEIFTLAGRSFFAFGGARSHDVTDGILEPEAPDYRERKRNLEEAGALFRVNHVSWWQEELPSAEEYRRGKRTLEENGWKCDYIISHCAPTSVQNYYAYGRFEPDVLTEYLEEIKTRCQYQKWFFGHYHDNEEVDEKHELLYERILRIL